MTSQKPEKAPFLRLEQWSPIPLSYMLNLSTCQQSICLVVHRNQVSHRATMLRVSSCIQVTCLTMQTCYVSHRANMLHVSYASCIQVTYRSPSVPKRCLGHCASKFIQCIMPTFAGITVHQVTYTYIQAIVHKVRLHILIDLNFTVNPWNTIKGTQWILSEAVSKQIWNRNWISKLFTKKLKSG